VYDNSSLTSTSQIVSGLASGTVYYWRVSASNSGGSSVFATPWTLTTVTTGPSAPPAPVLASPVNGSSGVSASPTFTWNASTGATAYELQVANDAGFTSLAWDQANISGTSFTVSGLIKGATYYWRVSASNSGGSSAWSAAYSLSTTKAGGGHKAAEIVSTNPGDELSTSGAGSAVPKSFELQQNYPNPFNPTTTISFSLHEASTVTLTVYNLVGQEIARLVSGSVEAGVHSVVWDAKDLSQNLVPSGVYLYRLQATSLATGKEEITQVRKMSFLK
jgi:hypothetical protein